MFVGVHAGAGTFGPTSEQQCRKVCRRSCHVAYRVLDATDNAVDACVAATVVLEDCLYTNAGVGSNLTRCGTVECDAGLMSSSARSFAAVGALAGIRNPILVSQKLLMLQQSSLVNPMLLVGQGAHDFAVEAGVTTCKPEDLIVSQSREAHARALKSYSTNITERMDTVGVICRDSAGRTAVSCSSGGVLLKLPGRVGHAAHCGAGCWTEHMDGFSVAVCSSGCGEALIRTNLCRSYSTFMFSAVCSNEDALLAECTDRFFRAKFLDELQRSEFDATHRLAGAIALISRPSGSEFLWFHNTPQMCIAYQQQGADKCVRSFCSVREATSGAACVVSSCLLRQ